MERRNDGTERTRTDADTSGPTRTKPGERDLDRGLNGNRVANPLYRELILNNGRSGRPMSGDPSGFVNRNECLSEVSGAWILRSCPRQSASVRVGPRSFCLGFRRSAVPSFRDSVVPRFRRSVVPRFRGSVDFAPSTSKVRKTREPKVPWSSSSAVPQTVTVDE